MRLVGYLRVSTAGQAKDGYGLADQRKAIRDWATANGHKIIKWCSDEGRSGTFDLEGRVQLAEAFEVVRSGRAQGIAVGRLDRWSRDVVLQEQLLKELTVAGGQLFSTVAAEQEQLADPTDPTRKLVRVILGAIADYDRTMTVLKLQRGRQRKAEAGGFAFGAPGYGYAKPEHKGGELRPDESEQAALRLIATMRADGRSLREIIEALDAEGHRTKRGARWNPGTLSRIVKRMESSAA